MAFMEGPSDPRGALLLACSPPIGLCAWLAGEGQNHWIGPLAVAGAAQNRGGCLGIGLPIKNH